ncbi:MAG: hypothetical protein GY822_18055 [Deltaproteobacteria bacterium]|nr:hypothetical protein [Deltaproteobacteria bacterium]
MALVRCPQCGRVAEPGCCFACGHEWDAAPVVEEVTAPIVVEDSPAVIAAPVLPEPAPLMSAPAAPAPAPTAPRAVSIPDAAPIETDAAEAGFDIDFDAAPEVPDAQLPSDSGIDFDVDAGPDFATGVTGDLREVLQDMGSQGLPSVPSSSVVAEVPPESKATTGLDANFAPFLGAPVSAPAVSASSAIDGGSGLDDIHFSIDAPEPAVYTSNSSLDTLEADLNFDLDEQIPVLSDLDDIELTSDEEELDPFGAAPLNFKSEPAPAKEAAAEPFAASIEAAAGAFAASVEDATDPFAVAAYAAPPKDFDSFGGTPPAPEAAPPAATAPLPSAAFGAPPPSSGDGPTFDPFAEITGPPVPTGDLDFDRTIVVGPRLDSVTAVAEVPADIVANGPSAPVFDATQQGQDLSVKLDGLARELAGAGNVEHAALLLEVQSWIRGQLLK